MNVTVPPAGRAFALGIWKGFHWLHQKKKFLQHILDGKEKNKIKFRTFLSRWATCYIHHSKELFTRWQLGFEAHWFPSCLDEPCIWMALGKQFVQGRKGGEGKSGWLLVFMQEQSALRESETLWTFRRAWGNSAEQLKIVGAASLQQGVKDSWSCSSSSLSLHLFARKHWWWGTKWMSPQTDSC